MMHAHDNCWRCGNWFSQGDYNEYQGVYSRGRLGLCWSCWKDLDLFIKMVLCVLACLAFIAWGITQIRLLLALPVLYILGWTIYGGIRFIRMLDDEGWLNFVDRIREKHLEPWERDK